MAMRQVEKQAEELSQLARFLFDAAANKWYSAAALDVINGLVAGILGLLDLTGSKGRRNSCISQTLPLRQEMQSGCRIKQRTCGMD